MTICCSKCGRALFEDQYGDWRGKSVSCEPSCLAMAKMIQRIGREIVTKLAAEEDPR